MQQHGGHNRVVFRKREPEPPVILPVESIPLVPVVASEVSRQGIAAE